MEAPERTLREDLHGFVGDGLRSIVEYSESRYDVLYVREDVAPLASDDRLTTAHEALTLRDFGRPFFQDAFEFGPLESTIYRFRDAAVAHVVHDESTGLYVAVDAEALEPMPTFMQRCRDYLEAVAED